MFITLIILGGLGLCFGSFVNALVWRVRQQSLVISLRSSVKSKRTNELATGDWRLATKKSQFSVLTGRSQCPDCGHQLAVRDLVPLISWLALRGHCRYCRQPISRLYPLIELAGAVIFLASYVFWPGGVHTSADWLQLGTWLAVSVGLLALLVYDARWMMLPSKIIYPTMLIAAAGQAVYIGSFESQPLRALAAWLLSLVVASGIFWLLFQLSEGKWIGYGDVRLGLVTGTVLASPLKALVMIMLASGLGAIFVLPLLATGRKKLTERLAFGPFLIVATGLVLLYGDRLINWYRQLLS